ncbi:MAG: hypothetical protein PHU91_01205, partial [Candidatus Omnitrophica bacterium]|nr:hypothetical protein [Candidatus Omnitrophota bacterium]
MKEKKLKRILEIIPGALSWSILITLFGLAIFRPFIAAIVIIVLLLYWVCRLLYMSVLLVMAHHRVLTQKHIAWLARCKEAKSDLRLDDILHVVLYTVYKEPKEVLEDSLRSLEGIDYPKDKMIVVLAGEERDPSSFDKLEYLKEKFKVHFKDILVTIHPKGVEG